MRRVAMVMTTAVLLISFLLVGCQGGIPPEQYQQIMDQIKEVQERFAEMQSKAKNLQAEKEAVADELQAAQATVAELEEQVSNLKEQYELVGVTPAEMAEKIVRNYHETHVYSTTDLFMCSDMSSEVWNMLKAQDINAIIVVGNKDTAITDILQCDHAWVLAEVAPGEYLALETTGGYAVPKDQNQLYYRGWYFESPADLKTHNQLVNEYNVRLSIRNQIAAEAQEVAEEHNQATDPNTADKLMAVYDKLVELREAQETEINDVKAELDSLATRL